MEKMKTVLPLIVGTIVAVILFFIPDAKPVACGGAAALPGFIWGGE